MFSYFPGGVIADHFSVRSLLTVSLLSTALGGLYMAQFPNQLGLSFLFAYWGVTTILLFWAALIRATREWGGNFSQGRAFGFLEGGRGLVAAAGASIAVLLFSTYLPTEIETATQMQRGMALQSVIYAYTLMTFAAGVLIWWLVPDDRNRKSLTVASPLLDMTQVFRLRAVWLQAIIVICAYSAYKGLDNYSLYVVQVLGMNEMESAQFTSIAAYLRPIAAIAAGFLADKFLTSRIINVLFTTLIICYAIFALASPPTMQANILYMNLVVSFIAVFGIRGVYFALLEETKIPTSTTGTAVGLISVIGFTPDIFFHSIAGRLLDAAPGPVGHQYFFAMLTVIATLGMVATIFLSNVSKRN